MTQKLIAVLKKPPKLTAKMNKTIVKLLPELEDLEVTPSGEEQKFKSSKYGFDNVTVKAVPSDELVITPTAEEQVHEGLYKKVTIPEEPDLKPENIAKDKEVFGVKGTGKIADFEITDGYYLCASGHRREIAQQLVNMCGAIISAYNMFYSCRELPEIDLTNLDTSQCTNMYQMFYHCDSLTELDLSNFDTSNVTTMYGMFGYCNLTELDLSNFDTSNVTTMGQMFYFCQKISKLDLSKWNTSKVTTMHSMFCTMSELVEIDVSNFDTSNVTDVSQLFLNNRKIINLDLSSWDLGKVINCYGMLGSMNGLTNVKSFKNLGKGYTQKTNNYSNYKLQHLNTAITKESLIDIITNGLYDLNLTYDVANGGTLYTQTFDIGSRNMGKLTDEELQIAYDKGWNVT